MGRYCFARCLSVYTRGRVYPMSIPWYFHPLVLCPFSGERGIPVSGFMPLPVVYPSLWSHVPSRGVTPVPGKGHPSSWQGVTQSGQDWGSAPLSGQETGLGYTPSPLVSTGLEFNRPVRTGDRTGYHPLRQKSRASTCYAAGGMPLGVTQKYFIVSAIVLFNEVFPNGRCIL